MRIYTTINTQDRKKKNKFIFIFWYHIITRFVYCALQIVNKFEWVNWWRLNQADQLPVAEMQMQCTVGQYWALNWKSVFQGFSLELLSCNIAVWLHKSALLRSQSCRPIRRAKTDILRVLDYNKRKGCLERQRLGQGQRYRIHYKVFILFFFAASFSLFEEQWKYGTDIQFDEWWQYTLT